MRVLVAGGAGFIGSHLVKSLVALGHDVDVIDDLSTGNIDNLRDIGRNPKLRIHFDRIENSALLGACIREVDFVYHLVPPSNEKNVKDDPAVFFRKVVSKAQTVFDHAAAQKVPTLITVSHSSDYLSSERRVSNDEIFGPADPYQTEFLSAAAANAIYEYTAMAYCAKRKQPIAIARLFNVAGPAQVTGLGKVIKNYIEQIMRGKSISVVGNGEHRWHFTEVTDVIAGLVNVLTTGIPVSGAIHDFARPVHVTTKELLEFAIELTGSSSVVKYYPAAANENRGRRHNDVATPRIDPNSLKQLVHATIDYINNNAAAWDEFQSAS
jgi:nucleoside-diphosphate-sugar epimerase